MTQIRSNHPTVTTQPVPAQRTETTRTPPARTPTPPPRAPSTPRPRPTPDQRATAREQQRRTEEMARERVHQTFGPIAPIPNPFTPGR